MIGCTEDPTPNPPPSSTTVQTIKNNTESHVTNDKVNTAAAQKAAAAQKTAQEAADAAIKANAPVPAGQPKETPPPVPAYQSTFPE
ncbi:MAG: hypothetical protein ACRCXZ_09265 [Patescibacteria group bacterium]